MRVFIWHWKVSKLSNHCTFPPFIGMLTLCCSLEILCSYLLVELDVFPCRLMNHIVGNIGFVFTKEDLNDIRDVLTSNQKEAPAKAGAIAPVDVFVAKVNTGLGPEKTSFFQALAIPTKITKGTIEILVSVVMFVHFLRTWPIKVVDLHVVPFHIGQSKLQNSSLPACEMIWEYRYIFCHLHPLIICFYWHTTLTYRITTY